MTTERGNYRIHYIARMAEEGVPYKAIARVMRLPEGRIKGVLKIAGIPLPAEEWPDGGRIRAAADPIVTPDPGLAWRVSNALHLPPGPSSLLTGLLVNDRLGITNAKRIGAVKGGTDEKIVHVLICHIRRQMRVFGLKAEIKTYWGQGYGITVEDRRFLREWVMQRTAALVEDFRTVA